MSSPCFRMVSTGYPQLCEKKHWIKQIWLGVFLKHVCLSVRIRQTIFSEVVHYVIVNTRRASWDVKNAWRTVSFLFWDLHCQSCDSIGLIQHRWKECRFLTEEQCIFTFFSICVFLALVYRLNITVSDCRFMWYACDFLSANGRH